MNKLNRDVDSMKIEEGDKIQPEYDDTHSSPSYSRDCPLWTSSSLMKMFQMDEEMMKNMAPKHHYSFGSTETIIYFSISNSNDCHMTVGAYVIHHHQRCHSSPLFNSLSLGNLTLCLLLPFHNFIMTQQYEKDASSLDELSTKSEEIQDGIDEDMKKEVDDVMEQCRVAIQWCAPSNVSKTRGHNMHIVWQSLLAEGWQVFSTHYKCSMLPLIGK